MLMSEISPSSFKFLLYFSEWILRLSFIKNENEQKKNDSMTLEKQTSTLLHYQVSSLLNSKCNPFFTQKKYEKIL